MVAPQQGDSRANGNSLLDALRAVDIDRYLGLLLMPEDVRDDLATLMLFNAEIAAIRDRIREALPGEIRLQWWHEVVSGGRAGEAEAHPLASRLIELIARRSMPVAPFTGMCEARVFDLYDDPMPDRGTYEGYAGETASALLQMSVFVLAPEATPKTAMASGHAGVAQAVAGHLMMLPITQRRGQVFVPGDLLAATGLGRDGLLEGKSSDRIDAAIRAFAGLGREHLAKARSAFAELPAGTRPAYLPVALAEPVFTRAEALGSRCLESSPRPSQLRRQWRLWRAARSGRI
ncbi:MAG: phytoene/squalene synthase family protein [Hoeflea sp.]|uniref:phytoene/squalene synthase family protein n=1 Tax=Hoeflea sp. TaxID=1940281 RepID=UPI0032EF8EC4